jgi:hypothetical protein
MCLFVVSQPASQWWTEKGGKDLHRWKQRARLPFCSLNRSASNMPLLSVLPPKHCPGTCRPTQCDVAAMPWWQVDKSNDPQLQQTATTLPLGSAADASLPEHTRCVAPGLHDTRSRLAAGNMCGQTLCLTCMRRNEGGLSRLPSFLLISRPSTRNTASTQHNTTFYILITEIPHLYICTPDTQHPPSSQQHRQRSAPTVASNRRSVEKQKTTGAVVSRDGSTSRASAHRTTNEREHGRHLCLS